MYNRILRYSVYTGEILERISSAIPLEAVFLDSGAGTCALTPLSRKVRRVVAVDTYSYQLVVCGEKAGNEGKMIFSILCRAERRPDS